MHGDHILMGKRRDNQKWTFPGGHVEPQETMKEGAMRELKEETGIEAHPLHIMPMTGIDEIKLECGYLLFAVRTEQGPARFIMRWTQSQVQDFGARGKVLLDVEDNRFLVSDVTLLGPRERELMQRYVYW